MSMQIRPSTPDDLEWLMAELKEFAEFFESQRSLFGDEQYWRDGLMMLMRDHLVLVAEGDEGLMGLIAGIKTPHLFNPKILVLSETFWWVSPRHRASRAGLLLLNAFIDYGKKNCDWITIALEDKSPINEKSLIKRGFRLKERSYLLENSDGGTDN